jgi:hypothetical protein
METIIKDCVNVGYNYWPIPFTQKEDNKNNYSVKIMNVNDTSVYAFSPKFNIIQPSSYYTITITKPTIGQVCNGAMQIIWASNFTKDVNIELYYLDKYKLTIAANCLNTGSYTWTPPSDMVEDKNNNYSIKISQQQDATINAISGKFSYQLNNPVVTDYTKYNSISDQNRASSFLENFDSNLNNWETKQGSDYKADMRSGYYNLTSYNDYNYLFSLSKCMMDEKQDYELETSINAFTMGDSWAAGVYWGGNASSYAFSFAIASDNYYTIDEYNGQYITWKDWTVSNALNMTGFNKLTVRKIGVKYYFFINEVFVYSYNVKSFYGNKFGIIVGSKSSIAVDYLKLNYLKTL